jgi:SAM-dependent methyltransferase
VEVSDAAALIRPAVPDRGGTWADFGAGSGTFTRALATVLGPEGHVYAIDRDPRAVAALRAWTAAQGRTAVAHGSPAAAVVVLEADFADLGRRLDLPPLDGALVANALHFVREPGPVLARIAAAVRPGGRVVLVEYDDRPASRWVPYPLPLARLPALAERAGLDDPSLVGTQPSAYGGRLYAAVLRRAE